MCPVPRSLMPAGTVLTVSMMVGGRLGRSVPRPLRRNLSSADRQPHRRVRDQRRQRRPGGAEGRLRAPSARGDRALQGLAGRVEDRPRPDGVRRRSACAARVRRRGGGVPQLRPWRMALSREVRRLRVEQDRCLLVSAAGILPELHGAAHVRLRRAARVQCVPARSGSAVGTTVPHGLERSWRSTPP